MNKRREYVRRSVEEKNLIALGAAKLMKEDDYTLQMISKEIGVPLTSVYRIMMDQLPEIDLDLYYEIRHILEVHFHHVRKRYT